LHFFTPADVTAAARGGRIVSLSALLEARVQRNWVLVLIGATALVAGAGYYSGRKTGLQEAHDAAPAASVKADAMAAARSRAAARNENSTARTRRIIHQKTPGGTAAKDDAAFLPPPGAPLKDIFDDLKARADAGDAAAASRLFHDLQRCAEAQRLGQFLPALANRMLDGNLPSSPGGIDRSERQLDWMQRGLELQRDSASMCAGLLPGQQAALVPSTLTAAQLGDPQAADCYVGANLNAWPGVLDNPDWISNYKNYALPLASAAVQQGDWAMVGMLASANAGNPRSNNMLNQLTGTDPVQAYTYAKLMSLGQPEGTTPSTRSTNALSTLSSQLTPEQIQAADTQAQSMYQQYFDATPRQTGQVMDSMRTCQAGF